MMSKARSVVIFQPVKNAMQSGKAGMGKYWHIRFDESQDDAEFIESLMGWTGSKNTQQQVKLRFESKEEAIAYAEREGLEYIVKEPKLRKLIKKSYADNFKYGS